MNDLDLFEDPSHRGRRDGHEGRSRGSQGRYGRRQGRHGGQEGPYDDRQTGYHDGRTGPHEGHQEDRYGAHQEGYYDPRQEGHYDPRQEGQYDPRQEGQYDPRQEGQYDPRQEGHYDSHQEGHYDPHREEYYDGQQEGHHEGAYEEPYEEPYEEEAGRRSTRKGRAAARKRQRRRKANGRAAVMFSLAFLVAVFGGGGLLGLVALEKRLSTPDYSGQGSGKVTVQIKDGDTGQLIGQRLEAADVVKSSKAYVRAANKEPRSASIQPGFYAMRKKMSGTAALALLLDPKSRAGSQITIQEGLRVSKTIEMLSKKTGIPVADFEAVVKDPKNLGLPSYAQGKVEGYLWPGRYDLDPNANAEATLKMMVDRFKKSADDLDLENRAKEAGMKPGTVIAMASIVQAESGKHSDMPKISEVIYNRIKKRMRLEMDSTSKYASGTFGIEATEQERASDSPYNTYKAFGLPPGAITNPGADAIEAVFKPSKSGWLFFVTVDPDKGITKFSTNLEDHNRLVAEYNKNKQQNGGG